MVVSNSQDCTAIAEHAKALASMGAGNGSDMKFAGTIPNVMIEKYLNDKNITYAEFIGNKEHIRSVMNDPAMAHFRVWKGKL